MLLSYNFNISMASTYWLLLLFSLLFYPIVINAQNYYEINCGPCESCCSDLYKSRKNDTPITVLEVEKIAKALRDSGYEALPLILEKHLRSINPYCKDFLFFVDRRNRLTIYGDHSVTLFVPPDEAVRFDKWVDLEYQIVMSKVDKEAFELGSISEGSKLVSSSARKQRLVVDRVFGNGTISINNVKINKWNIYNDGHVIVHGAEDFFNHFNGERAIIRDYWDVHPLNTDYMKIFEDPKTGSYTTKKMFVDDDELVVKLSSIQVLL